MSIIANALKKVQDKRATKIEDLTPPSDTQDFVTFLKAKSIEKNNKDNARKNIGLVAATAISILIIIAASVFFISGVRTAKTKSNSTIGLVYPALETVAEITDIEIEEPVPVQPAESVEPESSKAVDLKSARMLPALNGIMYSPSNPQVILNGGIFSVGESVNGYSIKEILPKSVVLASGDEVFTIQLR